MSMVANPAPNPATSINTKWQRKTTMNKHLFTLCVVGFVGAFGVSVAMAATVEGGAGTVSDTLTPKAQAVCDGPFVLTVEAMAACTSQTFPTALADGTRYRNTGIGAEFNTLIRQLPVVTANTSQNGGVSVPSAE